MWKCRQKSLKMWWNRFRLSGDIAIAKLSSSNRKQNNQKTMSYDVIRTNLQLKVSMNVNCVRNSEMKVQGFGPRASQTGPIRIPVISGGKAALTEQSTPRKPATWMNEWMNKWMNEWMNEWKCEDFKCVWKPTESRLCLTHYVNKSSRWAVTFGERRVPPWFAPATWNMHAATLSGGDRTNNHSEGWNNIWSATRNRQSGGCSRRCRPILLRRQQNSFVMLWARCCRRRRRKLLQRHGSDCCDCALNMSVVVVT